MTLASVWCSHERPEAPTLWMASDSRISDGAGTVIDEGIKLYEVPVVCRQPGPDGFFDRPYFATAIGMVGAGGSLVYQHVYGTLVPVLGNLIGNGEGIPSTADLAGLVGRTTATYVRSLGHVRPNEAARITILLGGHTPGKRPEAYRLSPRVGEEGMVEFPAEPLHLGPRDVHFIGAHTDEAYRIHSELVERNEPGASSDRAALNVIRALINDPSARTIGGEVQVGHMAGWAFRRVASCVADPEHRPQARMLLNSIDLDSLGPVGPCALGLQGMVVP
jgi:hypothetical protein